MTPPSGYAADVPLSQPLYGASFGAGIKRFFQKYATFSGRASRSEYWWSFLFNGVIETILYIAAVVIAVAGIDPVTGEPGAGFMLPLALLMLYSLAIIIPGIAVSVRRLHDAGYSGLLYLLVLVPFFGQLAIFVFMLLPSSPDGARFDEYPPQQYGYGPYGQGPQGYSSYGYPGQPGA